MPTLTTSAGSGRSRPRSCQTSLCRSRPRCFPSCGSTSGRSPRSSTQPCSPTWRGTSRTWTPSSPPQASTASCASFAATAASSPRAWRPRTRSTCSCPDPRGGGGGGTGAAWAAEQAGFEDFLTFDMGGTSTDVALVQGLKPRIGRETTVGDLKVRATSVDVRTVGAGGGSIAHVPALTQALRVGPQSAGAVPGPASYAAGGTEPTVTDANVVLGYLPTQLAGGEITLDRDAAHASVKSIADATGLHSVEAAAAGIIDIVNENMFGALRLVSVQQGFDPRDFALVAFGGAGPLHANALGKLTGAWPVIVPPWPGVLNAYGDATTVMREEVVRTLVRRFSELDDDSLSGILTDLADEAKATLTREGVPQDQQRVGYSADLRYHGQGFEIPVTIDIDAFDGSGGGVESMRKAFDAAHNQLFSFVLDAEHELVTVRATANGPRPDVTAIELE